MIRHDIEQNSEDWFNIRLGKFTASIAADLFAKKETAAYQNAILNCAFQHITKKEDTLDEKYTSKLMERGHDLEPMAAEHYELETFSEINLGGFWEYSKYAGASPDREVDDDGLLEIKCPKATTMIKYANNNELLLNEYYYQVHWQLLCTNKQWVDLMAYHPDLVPVIIRINRDESIIEILKSKLEESVKIVKQKIKIYYEQSYFNR